MSSNSLFRCSEHTPGQPVYLSVPSIHMDNQTCLCSFNTKHSLFVWFTTFFFYHPLPLLILPPPPLSHAATLPGFSRHFVFHCLPFGEVTHDTWWSVATAGGLLIEGKQSGKHGEARVVQAGRVGVRQREVEMRDCHQKK